MNDLDRILAQLPPLISDPRLTHVDQLVWHRVEKLRLKRGRMLLCSCVVAGTFMIGVTIGHFAGVSTKDSYSVMLLSDRV